MMLSMYERWWICFDYLKPSHFDAMKLRVSPNSRNGKPKSDEVWWDPNATVKTWGRDTSKISDDLWVVASVPRIGGRSSMCTSNHINTWLHMLYICMHPPYVYTMDTCFMQYPSAHQEQHVPLSLWLQNDPPSGNKSSINQSKKADHGHPRGFWIHHRDSVESCVFKNHH